MALQFHYWVWRILPTSNTWPTLLWCRYYLVWCRYGQCRWYPIVFYAQLQNKASIIAKNSRLYTLQVVLSGRAPKPTGTLMLIMWKILFSAHIKCEVKHNGIWGWDVHGGAELWQSELLFFWEICSKTLVFRWLAIYTCVTRLWAMCIKISTQKLIFPSFSSQQHWQDPHKVLPFLLFMICLRVVSLLICHTCLLS